VQRWELISLDFLLEEYVTTIKRKQSQRKMTIVHTAFFRWIQIQKKLKIFELFQTNKNMILVTRKIKRCLWKEAKLKRKSKCKRKNEEKRLRKL